MMVAAVVLMSSCANDPGTSTRDPAAFQSRYRSVAASEEPLPATTISDLAAPASIVVAGTITGVSEGPQYEVAIVDDEPEFSSSILVTVTSFDGDLYHIVHDSSPVIDADELRSTTSIRGDHAIRVSYSEQPILVRSSRSFIPRVCSLSVTMASLARYSPRSRTSPTHLRTSRHWRHWASMFVGSCTSPRSARSAATLDMIFNGP